MQTQPQATNIQDLNAALGDNLSESIPDAVPVAAKRVRIILEENDNIPPTGQFFSADGEACILRPGEEADVPESLVNILDCAVMSTPILDSGNSITGYRNRLRFPYRIVSGAPTRV